MPALPLGFIGWFFTIACLLAIAIGAFLILAVKRTEDTKRSVLSQTAWNDMMLFGIWLMGLAGGIGTIGREVWGRYMLEFFCWTLIVLSVLSTAARVVAMKREANMHGRWPGAIAGAALVLVPILLLCGATIVTLRGDAARAAFAGQ